MPRSTARKGAQCLSTPMLWRHLEENLAELARTAMYRSVPPERRQRTLFAHECVIELKRRGQATAMFDPSEGRASRNAILGWGD